MTAPVFKGAGAVTLGSGAPLTATGVPVVAGDVSLLVVAGSSSSVSTPAGWTACTGNDPSGPSLSVFWQRATGSGTPTATVTDGASTRALVIESFTGCVTSGDPTEAGATQQNARSTVMAIPTIATLGADRLVVLAGTPSADTTISAVSNDGTLANLSTRVEVDQTSSSQGIVIADGALSTEGSSGVSSATFGTSRISQTYAVALIPAGAPAPGGLSGTADLGFTATATGSLTGALIGSAGLAFAASAVIAAAGALSGSANLSLAATGTATETGVLAGTSNLTFAASATPNASGALAGSSNLTFTATANPTAAGRLAGSADLAFASTGALSGIGSLAGKAGLLWTASAIPSAIVALSGSADVTFTASATPTQDYTPDGRYYVQVAARPFYVSLPDRPFYVALSARPFYVSYESSDPMTQTFNGGEPMDPSEKAVLTLDGTPGLDPDETFTEILGDPVVTLSSGVPGSASVTVAGAIINIEPVQLVVNGQAITVGTGKGVQAVASKPVSGCTYEIAITCATTNPNKVLTLKGYLVASSK